MQSVSLSAETRSAKRRAAVKQLRASGKIPAVIYGKIADPQALAVDDKSFTDMLKHHASEHLLIDLNVDGDDRPQRLALLQEVQHHPLSGAVLHVDFHEIAADDKVTITVPVESTGEAVGVKVGGGLLEHVMKHVKMRGKAADIPEIFEVDVTPLEAGNTLHIGELTAPEGCEILGNASNPVFTCAGKRGPKAGEEEAEGAAAEGEAAKEESN